MTHLLLNGYKDNKFLVQRKIHTKRHEEASCQKDATKEPRTRAEGLKNK